MNTRASLSQQLRLQAKLSPAQIQMIRLLEVPLVDLQERINEELERNPLLEETDTPTDDKEIDTSNDEVSDTAEEDDDYESTLQNDDFNDDDYASNDETPDYKLPTLSRSSNSEQHEIPLANSMSLREYLLSQVMLIGLTAQQEQIARFIIENIDDDGFLRRDVGNIADDLSFHEGISVSDEAVQVVLHQIQQLDPIGVGATTIQECMLLQLQHLPDNKIVTLARKIVQNYFSELSHKNIARLASRMNVDETEVYEAYDLIVNLTPKPGIAWSNGMGHERNSDTIVPDFIVEEDNGQLHLSLNNGDVPYLAVNKDYEQMLNEMLSKRGKRSTQDREALRFIKSNLFEAKNFIAALNQRNETLIKTMTAIMHFQKDFFEGGENMSIRPMVLQDIADITGLDISTISRVCNSKYVQTSFGIFPLKYFFSEGITTETGEEFSTRDLKQILIQIIADEDKQHPFNDDELMAQLKEKGFVVARRTIAKYRKLLNIPVANIRKKI